MRLLIIAAIATICALPAHAGSCRYSAYGSGSAVQCDGGYYKYRSFGRTRSWGFRNNGYPRYSDDMPSYRTR